MSQATTSEPPRRQIRKVRHWKQRFDPEAEFIWRRAARVPGGSAAPGDRVEKSAFPLRRLRKLWDAEWIELAEWEAPDMRRRRLAAEARDGAEARGDVPPAGDVVVEYVGGSWYEVRVAGAEASERVRGRKALAAKLRPLGLEPPTEGSEPNRGPLELRPAVPGTGE